VARRSIPGGTRARAIAIALLWLAALLASGAAVADPGAPASFDERVGAAKAAMLGDPAKALAEAQRAERAAYDIDASQRATAIATAEWLQGEAYLRMNRIEQAGPQIDKALRRVDSQKTSSKLVGDLLLSRGALKTQSAEVAAALQSYQQAYRVFQKIGEVRSEAIAVISIGMLYEEAKDYEAALKYLRQSRDIYSGDPQLLFSVSSSSAIALQELHRFGDAQAEFRRALLLSRQIRSSVLEARTLRNIARGYLLERNVPAANQSIRAGLLAARDDGPSRQSPFVTLMAWSARLDGKIDEATRLITRFFDTVDPDASALDLREAHQVAYDIFKAAGNQTEALAHLEALKAFDDKTSTLAASANTALAAARFDFASQELKIEKLRRAQLQRDIDDAKLHARTQRTIFGGLAIAGGIIVGLLTFGLVTIRRSRDEVRAANLDLAETNAALAKALAAKTEFLATTSHEIRTPLNGILGMTQVMLADSAIDPAVRERITVVHGAGVTMRALVDDILDVAKMETGNLTIEAVPFDLRATLTEVSRLWEDQSRARGVRFVLDLAECPAFIVGDSGRLRQIAFNLLSNALKFTEQGTVTLRAVDEGEWLALSVADSGIGIPADKLDLIFESFRQVDAGTTRKFGGTGLGLAICRNLARAMHGDISVSSVSGTGSTFTVRLPLVRANGPEMAQPGKEGTDDTLLIVDRNPISRSMLRAVLEPRASAVAVAASIEQAIERIAQGGVARLLIDEATIRANPDQEAALAQVGALDVPSVLLWTTPSAQDQDRFARAGIDLVIAKPIAGTTLAARLFDKSADDKSPISGLVSQAA